MFSCNLYIAHRAGAGSAVVYNLFTSSTFDPQAQETWSHRLESPRRCRASSRCRRSSSAARPRLTPRNNAALRAAAVAGNPKHLAITRGARSSATHRGVIDERFSRRR
jgi:hypothetical protein